MKVYFEKKTVVLLIVLLIISGCQKTPEREVVADGRNLMEKIEVEAESKEYDIPSSWQETLSMKGSEEVIEINAPIEIPDVNFFPVYKTNKVLFDFEKTEELVAYFADSNIVIKDNGSTKEELENELILAKKNNDVETIAELENEIKSFQETIIEEITDWNPGNSPSGYFYDLDGIKTSINVEEENFIFSNGVIWTNSFFELNGIMLSNDVLLSEEDAVRTAQEMLHDIGIDYMIDVSFETAYQYSSMYDVFIDEGNGYLSKGYLIKFARIIDGIEGIINDFCIYNTREEINYKAPLYPEEIQIYVSEQEKVKFFIWRYPLEIGEILNDNVEILSFQDIKQRIRDMLIFNCSFYDNPVEVTSIVMRMTMISIENEPSDAMYVPAWFVNYIVTREDMDEEFREQEYTLVLNAIDGGRIIEFPIETEIEE